MREDGVTNPTEASVSREAENYSNHNTMTLPYGVAMTLAYMLLRLLLKFNDD